MNKVDLLCMNVVFFCDTRVSELASILTAIKFSKISVGAEPPCKISGGGGGAG